MMPQDIAAMLGGGGGAPPAGGGGMPPDVAALLGGGGPPEAAEGEPLPGVTDGAPGAGQDALTQAIDLIQEAIDAEADQEDVQVMLKAQTALQAILAKNQKEGDSMLQGKSTPSGVRKAAAGAMAPAEAGGGGY